MTAQFLNAMENSDFGDRSLQFDGKIRDPLHDSIALTKFETTVIGHPAFQRLRRIQQTAFIRYVFPGATHSRFEHSLGVMHLAGVLIQSLVTNQKRMNTDIENSVQKVPLILQKSFEIAELQFGSLTATKLAITHLEANPCLVQALRFAALLHDVGHAPFSHTGERFMPTWSEVAAFDFSKLPVYLYTALRTKAQRHISQGGKRIRHEIYTLMIVAKIFEELDPTMGQDVCAILDQDIKPAAGGVLETSGLVSLFHQIVSGEIDVDRMDYLLRDSRQCGVVYGLFDAGRIFDSAGFYFMPVEQKYHLALRKSGVAAFEDFLRARWSMYQQVYFHKTATACEAMLEYVQRISGGIVFPLDVDAFLALDDSNFIPFVKSQNVKNEWEVLDVLKELLLERKLWKRVYEENTPSNAWSKSPSLCPAVQHYLQEIKVPSSLIESSTSLTRFSPKGRDHTSKNSLKVIVKDLHSLRYLEPIENHSRLINRLDEETITKRVFVARHTPDGQKLDLDLIRKNLSNSIITPTI